MSSKIQPPSLTVLADKLDLETAAERADILPPQSAAIMEVALERNPLDILNRARLLAFYAKRETLARSKNVDCASYCDLRTRHILWFIKNVPDCVFAGDFYLALDKVQDKANYQKVAKAWLAAADEAPENTQIKVNAALYFCKQEPVKALKLLNEVLDIEPDNPWVLEIADKLKFSTLLSRVNTSRHQQAYLEDLSGRVCEDWAKLCDVSYVGRSFFDGNRLSAVTVDTLKRLLISVPDDLSARACIMSYYGERCVRANIIGFDPYSEQIFVEQLLWFLARTLGSDCILQIRLPDLSLGTRKMLVSILKKRMATLRGKAAGNAAKLLEWLRPRTNAEKCAEEALLRRRGVTENVPGGLDELAICVNNPDIVTPLSYERFSITEWADESDMLSAALAGSYNWLVPGHQMELENVLETNSVDLRSRALIIGNYRHGKVEENRTSKAVYLKHLCWLIKHVPGCKFLESFYWEGLHVDSELSRKVTNLWLHVANSTTDNVVLLNAALGILASNPTEARNLIVRVLQKDASNKFAGMLLEKLEKKESKDERAKFLRNRRTRRTECSMKILKQHNFIAGCKSTRISKASKNVDFLGSYLFAVSGYPSRSCWTTEQVLLVNAHDLALRAEILGLGHKPGYCYAIGQANPDDMARQLFHTLWWVQHDPCNNKLIAKIDEHLDPAGFRAVFEAWKLQHEAYPDNLAIVQNISSAAFGTDFTLEDGILIVSKMLKKHPRNRSLARRLEHLESLNRA